MWFMGVTALEMMNALRRELSEGLFPLPEIFTALVHLFGSKGYANRGLEILAVMDKLNYDIRHVWLVLIGVESRLRATDEIYDLLIEEDCKVVDHSNASRDLKRVLRSIRLLLNFTFEPIVNAFVQLIASMSRLLKFVIQLLTAGQNIRKFVKDGFIINELPKIHSRSHARRMKESKRKRRHSGYSIFLAFLFVFL
ncbi:plastid transcriptionally active 3 [Tanacetum coccineum]